MTTGTSRVSTLGRMGLALFGVLLVVLAWQASTRSVDFPVYHRIASQLLAGDHELYPPQVYSGAEMPPHGFRYLPIVAWFFVPFGLLPLPVAAFVFFVIKLGVLAWMGRSVASSAGLWRDGWAYPTAALVAVAGYAAEEFRYGNAHLLVVALLVLTWIRSARGEVLLPAAALALAIATKVTPLAMLGYLALRRRVAVCAACVVILAALVAAPIPLVGVTTNAHLLTGFVRYALQKTEELDNYSLRGALHRVRRGTAGTGVTTPVGSAVGDSLPAGRASSLPADGETIAWLGTTAVLGLLTLVVLWRAPGDTLTSLLEFSLVLVAMLVVSPHTQRRYFVQLYVPVLVLLGVLRATGTMREQRWARVGIGATVASGTLLPLVFGGPRLALAYQSTAPYFWGTAVLFVALLVITHDRKRGAGS